MWHYLNLVIWKVWFWKMRLILISLDLEWREILFCLIFSLLTLCPAEVCPVKLRVSPCLPGKSLVRASADPGRRQVRRWGLPLQGPDQDTLSPVPPVCPPPATPNPPCPWPTGENSCEHDLYKHIWTLLLVINAETFSAVKCSTSLLFFWE